MSLTERISDETQIDITTNNAPPKGNRRVRDWKRVIGTLRKLESQDSIVLNDVRNQLSKMASEKTDLLEHLYAAREELAAFRLAKKMAEMGIDVEKQQTLLGGSHDTNQTHRVLTSGETEKVEEPQTV